MVDSEILKRVVVWRKAQIIDGFNPNIWRKDKFGSIIKFSDYGNTNSVYGWEIDHQFPKILSELLPNVNSISNLQPLNWQNNRSKGSKILA